MRRTSATNWQSSLFFSLFYDFFPDYSKSGFEPIMHPMRARGSKIPVLGMNQIKTNWKTHEMILRIKT
jgi:hypothetical protein